MHAGCSHVRAVDYYTESIKADPNKMAFMGYPMDEDDPMNDGSRGDPSARLQMGEPLQRNKVGHQKYYVDVTEDKPYYI